jgi:CMP-N-acetylneuraminic acid synthetase
MIIFIPARSGSKSIKDKNIKELGGKPLIAWTIEASLKTGLRTIVSSDSEQYLKIAKEYGAETLLRPKELAKDNTSMYEVLKSEIYKVEPIPEVVVLLSPTVPFRKTVIIKSAISFFTKSLDNYDSLMTVQKVPEKYNPAQVIIKTSLGLRMADNRHISNRITRRQEYPESYVTSQGIYIFKTKNLEKGNFYGDNVMILECDESIDLNTKEDWILLENELLKKATK